MNRKRKIIPAENNGSNGSGTRGTQSNPYSRDEFYNWEGRWPGGYVDGLGYVAADTDIISNNGSSGSGSSGSGMDYWNTHGVWSTDEYGNVTWKRTS